MEKFEKIQQLKSLLDSGAITQEEYEVEKKKILTEEKVAAPVSSSKSYQKSSWENNLRQFVNGCKMDDSVCSWLRGKVIVGFVIALLIMFVVLSNCGVFLWTFAKVFLVVEALFMFVCAIKTTGILPKVVSVVTLISATTLCFIYMNPTTPLDSAGNTFYISFAQKMIYALLGSFAYVILANLYIPKEIDIKKRLISSFVLAIPLNPIFWMTEIAGGVVCVRQNIYGGTDLSSYMYDSYYLGIVCLVAMVSIVILYLLMSRTSLVSVFRKTVNIVKAYKKAVYVVSAIITLGFVAYLCMCKYKQVQFEKAQIERAYNDSIAAVKAAEKARKDAIARAKRDSIAYIQKLKNDSIDKAEHQGFVKKYTNLGLMITYLEMTRGRDKDGETIKGIKFKIFNPTQKTIKYVSAIITPINAVNDVLSSPKKCRGIGPIGSLETGEWEFEDVFYDRNDIIDDMSVVFEVVYTNGGSKIIKWKDAYVSSYKTSWFL